MDTRSSLDMLEGWGEWYGGREEMVLVDRRCLAHPYEPARPARAEYAGSGAMWACWLCLRRSKRRF